MSSQDDQSILKLFELHDHLKIHSKTHLVGYDVKLFVSVANARPGHTLDQSHVDIFLCECGALWRENFEMIDPNLVDKYTSRSWTSDPSSLIMPWTMDRFYAIYGKQHDNIYYSRTKPARFF